MALFQTTAIVQPSTARSALSEKLLSAMIHRLQSDSPIEELCVPLQELTHDAFRTAHQTMENIVNVRYSSHSKATSRRKLWDGPVTLRIQ